MSDELPPLPEDVRALLDAAEPPAPPSGFEERVLAKVKATLGEGFGGPSGGDGPAGGGAPGGGAVAPSVGGVAGGGAVTLSKGAVALGTAVLVGAGVSGGIMLGRTVFAPELLPVVASTPAAVSNPPAVVKAEESPPPTPLSAPPDVKPSLRTLRIEAPKQDTTKVASGGKRDTELSAERALLEVARTALTRGDIAATLEAVERHAKEFPRGRLEEEREVLFIQALVQAGKRDEAQARAQAFRARFPDSLMLPAVDAALP